MNAENADMHYMYGRANGNGRDALRMYHAQSPDQRMPDHRIFQWLHRQLHKMSTSPDMMLVDEELYTVQAWKKACDIPRPGGTISSSTRPRFVGKNYRSPKFVIINLIYYCLNILINTTKVLLIGM
ncbi:hypothetical protein TNCV_2902531 [Trichonephila clavipes]|nr:hypothetical protein TNCV_2902531 [Trichonephila clavipes]